MMVATTWRHVARRAPWLQLNLVTVLCVPILAARAATARSPFDVLPFARFGAVALAAAAVLAIEDPAAPVTATTATGRLRLQVWACAATAVLLCGMWMVLMTTARVTAATPQRLPQGGLLLELLALCAAGWSIAAWTRMVAGDRFLAARAAGVLVMCVVATLTTPRLIHWFWVGPGTEWGRAHVRWAVVGSAAVVLLLGLSSDPARRAIRQPMNRRAGSTRQTE